MDFEAACSVYIRFRGVNGYLLRALIGHTGEVTSVAFSPHDSGLVLTGSADGTARLWDTGTGRALRVFRHGAGVSSVAFSPDGRSFITGAQELSEHLEGGTARLWDVGTDRALQVFRHGAGVSSVAFSPDGRSFITGGVDADSVLPDGRRVPVVGEKPKGPLEALTF